jgi:hypothetical protein
LVRDTEKRHAREESKKTHWNEPMKMRRVARFPYRALWIIPAGGAVLLQSFLLRHPEITETYYSRGIFAGFRWIWDYTLGLLPIPLVYPLLAALAAWVVLRGLWLIRRVRRKEEKPTWRARFIDISATLFAAAGIIVILFYFTWGFNYSRQPIEKILGLKPMPLDQSALLREAEPAMLALSESRAAIPGAGESPLSPNSLPSDLESRIRAGLTGVLKELGYPTPGRVRVRKLLPRDFLMRFYISGIYIPFLGEGYIPGGLTPHEIPFSMAHEMAHGFGFTEEGTANFLAYMACEKSALPIIQYSGRLGYWNYLARALNRAAPGIYAKMEWGMPRGIMLDRMAAYRNWIRFRGRISRVSGEINDRYLKSQGIREGVLSYDRMVVLVHAWRKHLRYQRPGIRR